MRSTDEAAAWNLLGMPGEDFDHRVLGSQHRPHASIGLDGDDVVDTLSQQSRQDAGASPDLEDVGRTLRDEPVESLLRRA